MKKTNDLEALFGGDQSTPVKITASWPVTVKSSGPFLTTWYDCMAYNMNNRRTYYIPIHEDFCFMNDPCSPGLVRYASPLNLPLFVSACIGLVVGYRFAHP